VATGPLFANNLCVLEYGATGTWLQIEHNVPDGDGRPDLAEAPRVQLA
jgi:hypothetical protein